MGKGVLKLTITNSDGVKHRYLRSKDRLIIGRDLHTELPLLGQHYPRRHVLFKSQNDHFLLRLQDYMEGEIVFKDSTLSFKDLIKHNLLERRGNSYLLRILPERKGKVRIGDTAIAFSFEGAPQEGAEQPGYWRFRSHFKSLTRDWTFKIIFLFFLVANSFFVHRVNTVELPEQKPLDIEKIPQRLARFIIKPPSIKNEVKVGEEITATSGSKEEKLTTKESTSKGGAKSAEVAKSVARAGLLGVITGTGPTSKPSAVVDFLVDKGLARELKDVLSTTTNLKTNSTPEKKDILSELDLNIEAPAVEVDKIAPVELKKGKVNLSEAEKITGLKETHGWRSEESVRGVILSHLNRITYTYNKFLKRNPQLRGKIVIEITIAPSGEITACRLVASTVHNPEFERAILNIVRRWRFDPIPQGTVTVNYPFVFFKSS